MGWQQWALVVYFTINALASIGTIGKPRPTITGEIACWMVIFYALLIWMVVSI